MKKYQKPSFEAIQYDVEEILTLSVDYNGPTDEDDDYGDFFG